MKLLPCPFCTGEAREKPSRGTTPTVECTVCGATARSPSAWNVRGGKRPEEPGRRKPAADPTDPHGDRAWLERRRSQGWK